VIATEEVGYSRLNLQTREGTRKDEAT